MRCPSIRRFVANLARAISYIEAMRPKPDLVVATGDLTDNGLPDEYRLLRELLDGFEIPVRLIPGNHDEIEPLVEVLDDHSYLPRDGVPLQYVIDGTCVSSRSIRRDPVTTRGCSTETDCAGSTRR